MGNIVRFAMRAINIAKAVKTPKYIVGVNLENIITAKPNDMVIEV